MKGKLYLISCPLEGQPLEAALPAHAIEIVSSLEYFLAENAKTARAFLKSLPLKTKLQDLQIHEFNKDSKSEELKKLLLPAIDSQNIGVLSETGSPCIADPGSAIVMIANQSNIEILPLVGPSAVMMAILSSGLNGQNFAFNGYLPVKTPELENKIRELERLSQRTGQSQFFIETPYRLEKLFSRLLQICDSQTYISLSLNVGSSNQLIKTRKVFEWKQEQLNLDGQLGIIGFSARQ